MALTLRHIKCGLCSSNDYRKKYEIKAKIPFTIVECKNCGLIYVNPIVEKLEKLYEKDYYLGSSETGFNFTNPLAYQEETRLIHAERLTKIGKITGLKSGR